MSEAKPYTDAELASLANDLDPIPVPGAEMSFGFVSLNAAGVRSLLATVDALRADRDRLRLELEMARKDFLNSAAQTTDQMARDALFMYGDRLTLVLAASESALVPSAPDEDASE